MPRFVNRGESVLLLDLLTSFRSMEQSVFLGLGGMNNGDHH